MDLLLSQRIVLEAISNKADTIEKIVKSTGLSKSMINNIIPEFLLLNIIKYKEGSYVLDRETNPKWIQEISKVENVKMEIKEMLSSSVDLMNKGAVVNLRKIYLSEFEEKLLKIELARVEKLIVDLQKNSGVNKDVKDMKVVYWGYSGYGDILNNKVS
ncbi:hypothetical protein [Halobacteriovorax sp.]|uniref:hypothetical protein n=1 Tax=Halobacteriovorax sp. TaxID=2020862 RepID=UPI003562D712